MRAFVRAALEEGGFAEVTEAGNGFEALRLLPRERYDLVVTDINMPDIHGLELISFMRKSEVHADDAGDHREHRGGAARSRSRHRARRQRLPDQAVRSRGAARDGAARRRGAQRAREERVR